MSDKDHAEKLIVTLGQRIGEQNGILRTIAASLQGLESHLRQIALSSNPAPNYQRPLNEYPRLTGPRSAQPLSIGMTTAPRLSNGTARSSRADRRPTNSMRLFGFRGILVKILMAISGMRD